MNNELLTILEYIERERGISREALIGVLEAAILSASHKSIHPATNLSVKIDPATGAIQAWAKLEAVKEFPNSDQILIDLAQTKIPDAKLGDIIDWEVTPRNFGRIAAQNAKQVITQLLRRAEKETVRDAFADQIGQIITNGLVKRFEAGGLVVDFGKAEGIMPAREKIYSEHYMPGDHINALLLDVDIDSAGPSLIISRSDPKFVVRLFEREVSEIRDGVVEIMGIAREAGSRSKIAVRSNDPRVDPVGACVGVRGHRVKQITDELNNERIDIIPWDEDIRKYTMNALLPAKVQSVEVDEAKHLLTVHATEDQAKLAFGKKAQNVRLCGKLIGWEVNIKSEAGAGLEEKIVRAAESLAGEFGIALGTAELLIRSGYITGEGLAAAGRDQVAKVKGIPAEELDKIFGQLNQQ
ncbi:MAG: transcription termination factor NusA [Victivallaceae bacterium]|nr:transcription termination factor NusA [Victivallaceae bacterium]